MRDEWKTQFGRDAPCDAAKRIDLSAQPARHTDADGLSAALVGRLPVTRAAQPAVTGDHPPEHGERHMSYVTTRDGARIFFKDWGDQAGRPSVFSHGWPLSADDWDA